MDILSYANRGVVWAGLALGLVLWCSDLEG